ncbi:MAG: hypothetical protein HOV83_09815 [Catenulispora sp.]|nr:hypothetical protein [Catenulispora sp.]
MSLSGVLCRPCPPAQIDVSATVNTRAGSSMPPVRAGEQVVVDYRLTNSGSARLVDVQITEPGAVGGTVVCAGGGHSVVLRPGASVDCTARVSALPGSHAGTATVSARVDRDGDDDEDDRSQVSASAAVGYRGVASSLGVAEHVSMSPDISGAQVTVVYVLTNTGQASLFDFSVADAVLPSGATCPGTSSGLAPGASMTCTGAAHLAAGAYHSSATATADDRTTTVGADGQSVPPPRISGASAADFKVVALPPPPSSPPPTSPAPRPSPPGSPKPTPSSPPPPASVPPPPATPPSAPHSPPPSTPTPPPSSPPTPSSAPASPSASHRPPTEPAAQLAARPGLKTPLFLLVMMLPAAGAAAVLAARRK